MNGEVKEEIPKSIYDEENNIVFIFSPTDSYRYEVVGTDEGRYGLRITSIDTAWRGLKDVKIEVLKGGEVKKSTFTDANGTYSISGLSGI